MTIQRYARIAGVLALLSGSVLLCGFLCAFAPWREPDRLQKEVSRKDAETQSAAKSK